MISVASYEYFPYFPSAHEISELREIAAKTTVDQDSFPGLYKLVTRSKLLLRL